MAEGVERFAFTPADEFGPSMPVVMSNGDWVRYSDYEKLEAEREACADEADRLNAMAQKANRQRDQALQSEQYEKTRRWLDRSEATAEAQRDVLVASLGRIRAAAESDAEVGDALRDFLVGETVAAFQAAGIDPSGEGDGDGNWYFDAPPEDEKESCPICGGAKQRVVREGHDPVMRPCPGCSDPSGEQGEGRIAKLEALEDGWDSYGGVAPTEDALDRLRGFDRALSYVPIGDGSVQVEFHALGLDFEVVIERDGSVGEYDLTPATDTSKEER